MRQRWLLVVLTVAVGSALGVSATSPALAGEHYADNYAKHLMCYKTKDKTKYKGTLVDLFTQKMGKLTNCQVKKANEFCVPAKKAVNTVGSAVHPLDYEGTGCPEDYVCLKIKCDKVDAETSSVLDQFGVRNVDLKKPVKLCIPAVKACVQTGRTLVESCQNLSDPNSAAACDHAWQISRGTGVATACFYGPNAHGSTGCYGCGPNNEKADVCTNRCIDWPLCGSRTFVGSCNDLSDPNSEAACNNSWQLYSQRVTSCFYGLNYSGSGPNCFRCSSADEEAGLCTNACVDACHGYLGAPSAPID